MTATQARSADLSPCRVLVVEDNPANQRLLEALLRSLGVGQVDMAGDGIEGLEKAAAEMPSLILLDIMMPRMDGLEFLARLRADTGLKDVPVLVQTALSAADERNRIFEAGATDLVTKPLNAPELLARVRIHLENRLMVKALSDYRLRISAELDIARSMQRALLPSDDTLAQVAEAAGIGLDAHWEPSTELGGDLWGLAPLDGGRLSFWIADFSGHGVTAALNTFRLHALVGQRPFSEGSPAAYMQHVNEVLAEMLPVEQFATVLMGIVDARAGKLVYATAGAPSPFLMREGTFEVLEGGGLPLGITAAARYEDIEVDFPAGTNLVLYSDALYESPDHGGTALEEEGAARLVRETLGDGAGTKASPLPDLVERFHARIPRPLPDDLTLVWLGS